MIDPDDLFYAGTRVEDIVQVFECPGETYSAKIYLRNGQGVLTTDACVVAVSRIARKLANLEAARAALNCPRELEWAARVLSGMKPGRTPTREQFDAAQAVARILGGGR